MPEYSVTDIPEHFDSVKVANILDTSAFKATMTLYFESQRHSGGGLIEHVEYLTVNGDKRKAVIKFQDPTGLVLFILILCINQWPVGI